MSTTTVSAPGAPLGSSRADPGDADAGFFAYHGPWAPGVRLFRGLGFTAKALLIALTFLLPIAWLGFQYFKSQAASIEFSAKERLGVQFAGDALPALRVLQQRRRAAVLGEAAPAELAATLQRLGEREAQLREALGTASAQAQLTAALRAADSAVGDADARMAAHTAPIDALLTLLGVATDNSNLTLDPDIDTYYLMDAALFRLPVMLEATAQLRTVGGRALTAGSIDAAQRRLLIERLAVLQSNADALEAGLAKAVAYNADVAAQVKPVAAVAALKALAARVESQLLGDGAPQGDAAAFMTTAQDTAVALTALAKQATDQLDALVAARVDRMAQARNITAVVLLVGLLAAAYLFASFRLVLAGGLSQIAWHLNAMRDGNLDTRLRAHGRDEVASLIGSLNDMQQSLRRIVRQVRSAADGLVSASGEIAGGADDLRVRTEQAAASLQQTASAMEQIASTVKQNEATLAEATQLAAGSADAAESGGRIIAQVFTTMESINASSGRIGDIIGTIDGIAFQTNILALNAAVEAARAGEQGRGFAVVAAEVRALALRTTEAAAEIKGLITASANQVEGGVKVVRSAGEAVQQIVGTAQRVRTLLAEVAVGAREQTQGVAESARAVQHLDAVTQQNAALVEQTAASAGALRGHANGLASEVAQFQLT